MTHPCLRCGACCAHFRVAFHWMEADAEGGGVVPSEFTVKLDPHRVAMHGTEGAKPRCLSLLGEVGKDASCGIYLQRPSPCHDLQPAWENGEASPQCDRARIAHGLEPLTVGDWGAVIKQQSQPIKI
ncbi:YkgJ family cysteine cluster protein [Glaciimonas sp. PCH181]|uniref:YkgJ family cysteine cluster protein n=1 Tax=Glaciimonas sp. PCH181 TaxID=2133943 RepID=UPI000D3DBFAD|nr:YkgJ family cysteine cluster protein [Glaciimonas sp. PCH181]PUA17930.1 zinc/iron-chelating domain-containing protein [Glaciimonas sp. PCH181]